MQASRVDAPRAKIIDIIDVPPCIPINPKAVYHDTNLKTPYESLTPSQMVDYVETDKTLAYMDRMERKVRIEEERKRKMSRSLPHHYRHC